jgi:hypothetical protein
MCSSFALLAIIPAASLAEGTAGFPSERSEGSRRFVDLYCRLRFSTTKLVTLGKSSTILLPNQPGTVNDLLTQIMAGFEATKQS